MTEVLLGFFSGLAFGFIIQRMGATDANRMARAHLMLDPDIPQFMVLTVALSAVGLLGLVAVNTGREMVLPVSLVATGLAAVIFGAGWGLAGYCPGTCWAAVGEGRMDAIFALLGGLAGTAVFAHFHETLIPLLYSPTNLGPRTLGDFFGGRIQGTLILAGLFIAGVFAMGRLWKNDPRY